MSASAVFILDVKGKPLISRNYKGDVAMSEIDYFMPLLMQQEEDGVLAPLLSHGRVHFLWIKHSNLYLVATTLKNANASLVYSFLYKAVEVFSEYFKELEEESIRDNFVVIYELLDELMDFGFPQTTDSKILQEYITQQGNKLETGKSRVPPTVTNAVSWRSEGIKYKKNEVFIDVIESVNLLVNANGSVLLSEIVGTIKLKVFLSGMPELRLGLNDRVLFELTGRSKNKSVELEDVKFHQCVRLSRFDNDRTISFIPPDGDFELMSYRLSTQVKPLIWIESVIEKFSHSRVEIMVKVGLGRDGLKGQACPPPPPLSPPPATPPPGPSSFLFLRDLLFIYFIYPPPTVVCSLCPFAVCSSVSACILVSGTGNLCFSLLRHLAVSALRACGATPGRAVLFSCRAACIAGRLLACGARLRGDTPAWQGTPCAHRHCGVSGYQALPWVRYITQSGDYQLRTT
ncbi:AP-1 complex subunit mu-2 [Dasypus novemcinctus]|uniref:AP-1 complex subunit mu-2 n=1 Tax=Dasypus novemcinctus TaxID=9361 RepID=UPI00265E0009|nr:AP-1 complex subunit mu-2 [Dasypus novemcinctus]